MGRGISAEHTEGSNSDGGRVFTVNPRPMVFYK